MMRRQKAQLCWAIAGSLTFMALVGCSDGRASSNGTTTGGSGGMANGGDGGGVTGGAGGSGGSGTGSGEAGADTTSSAGGTSATGGEAGAAGAPSATGGGGGTGGELRYVPVQLRSDGLWPELDQILPRELADDEAMCRITHYASNSGDVIESWTWQYDRENAQPIRLTHDVPNVVGSHEARAVTAVFDERGAYWTVCNPDEGCVLFEEPTSVDWNEPERYQDTCPGTPPEGGFEQPSNTCEVPSSRHNVCNGAAIPGGYRYRGLWQFTEANELRRFVPNGRASARDVDCYIDGVLRATGSVGDFSYTRVEYYADGNLERSYRWSDSYGVEYTLCDENGWRSEVYDEQDAEITERYSFHGDDPQRPDELVFELERTYPACSETLSATLEWSGDSFEIHPDETGDPSLEAATWSLELNPDTVSAKLDERGNVVEVYASTFSNLQDLGLRQLGPERVGVYTFEGEGECLRGTNPHLFLGSVGTMLWMGGVLPNRSGPASCSTGLVSVTGYESVCEE